MLFSYILGLIKYFIESTSYNEFILTFSYMIILTLIVLVFRKLVWR